MPTYPAVAAKAGHQGMVTLMLTLASDGSVSHVEVRSSSGHQELDQAAVQAAQAWSFAPGERPRGSSSQAFMLVPVTFTLEGLKVSMPL